MYTSIKQSDHIAKKLVYYIFGILETILLLRFILKLLKANPSADFTKFIYEITQPFVQPFVNVFVSTKSGGVIFEWTTLLALLVYWIIAIAIIEIFFIISKPKVVIRDY